MAVHVVEQVRVSRRAGAMELEGIEAEARKAAETRTPAVLEVDAGLVLGLISEVRAARQAKKARSGGR
jgi:hypothetical protein